jgi:adenylate cyclase
MRNNSLSLRRRARTCAPRGSISGPRARAIPRVDERAAAPLPERKLAAILAADVVGYSRLMHENEEAALATLSGHRAIIDDLIAVWRGKITGTAGDSVLAEFASVIDAVNCGVAIQQALAAANSALPTGRQMQLRIGINVGDIMVHDGDVFGDGVNVAARLESLAQPGGICVTRAVRDHVRDRVEYDFDDLGEQLVKNIARPLRVFRLVFDPNAPPAHTPTSISSPARTLVSGAATGADTIELSFWHSVEAGGTAPEYQAYLERYPEGSFAALAEARLAQMSEAQVQIQNPSVELAFWESVKDSEDPEMFRAYLQKFPNGEFRSLAEIRSRSAGAPSALASLSELLKSAFSSEASTP